MIREWIALKIELETIWAHPAIYNGTMAIKGQHSCGLPRRYEELSATSVQTFGASAGTMLSMFGYYVQAIVTGNGHVEHWSSHMADPWQSMV